MWDEEQKLINDYIKNNPVKVKEDLWYSKCEACGAKVTANSKRPVTTYSGAMKSVYTDSLDSFPFDQKEDLCNSCLNSIKHLSSDLNSMFSSDNETVVTPENTTHQHPDSILNSQYLDAENNYQGFSSIDRLEGIDFSSDFRN